MIFALGNFEHAIPLSFEDEPEPARIQPDYSDPAVRILLRISHASKRRAAKAYLWRNNIQPWQDWLRGCQCEACKAKRHWSDCAVHNAPAYPVGPCDCGAA